MKRIIVLIVVALTLGCVFYQDMLLQHFIAPDDRVAAPMQSSRTRFSDNYYYYILAKKAVLRLDPFVEDNVKEAQSFFYKNSGQENVYSGALLVAGLFDNIAQLMPADWNMKTLLAFIFQAGFLFFSVLLLYIILRGSKSVSWVELLLFGFLVAYCSRGIIYGIYVGNLSYVYTISPFYYPDFFRLVNPQITWAYSLIYVAFLILFFQKRDIKVYVVLVLLSLLFGIFSMPLTATLMLGLGLHGLVVSLKNRKIDYYLLGIGLALSASFLFAHHQMDLFYETEKGQNLQTGYLAGWHIKINYFYMLIFLPLIRYFLPTEAKSFLTWLYIASLFLGSICDSFYLGSRIWLRGSAIFVHFLVIYALLELLRTLFLARWEKLSASRVIPVLILAMLVIITYLSLAPNYTGWYGYIEKNKADVIGWLRTHAERGDVIVSPNLEDAYYIPQYTNSQPYVQLFDYSPLSPQLLMSRYFQVLDMFGVKDKYTQRLVNFTTTQSAKMAQDIESKLQKRVDYEDYQTYSFYTELMYYPYNKSVSNIFLTAEANEEFHRKVIDVARSSNTDQITKIDFIIYEKNAGMNKPQGYATQYENAQYEILSKH